MCLQEITAITHSLSSTPLQFDVASWFTRYVHGWLRATEEKTVQWVDSVIQQDPVSGLVVYGDLCYGKPVHQTWIAN